MENRVFGDPSLTPFNMRDLSTEKTENSRVRAVSSFRQRVVQNQNTFRNVWLSDAVSDA